MAPPNSKSPTGERSLRFPCWLPRRQWRGRRSTWCFRPSGRPAGRATWALSASPSLPGSRRLRTATGWPGLRRSVAKSPHLFFDIRGQRRPNRRAWRRRCKSLRCAGTGVPGGPFRLATGPPAPSALYSHTPPTPPVLIWQINRLHLARSRRAFKESESRTAVSN